METKKPRGFACMDPARRLEIAQMGGRSTPPEKRTFSLDVSKASAAGRKGALARKRAVTDREGGI